MRKLKRDKVVSIANGRELVGVYFADTNGSHALIECSPAKADRIIKAWNRNESELPDLFEYEIEIIEANGKKVGISTIISDSFIQKGDTLKVIKELDAYEG